MKPSTENSRQLIAGAVCPRGSPTDYMVYFCPMTFFRRLNTFTQKHLTAIFGALIFIIAFASYVATLAPAQVPGDPSEYTFIPWILGIAHPPGYGFYTLLAALWQRLIPIGSVAYRTNLLAATAGALSATLVFAIVQRLIAGGHSERSEESQRNKARTLRMSAAVRRRAVRCRSAQGEIGTCIWT